MYVGAADAQLRSCEKKEKTTNRRRRKQASFNLLLITNLYRWKNRTDIPSRVQLQHLRPLKLPFNCQQTLGLTSLAFDTMTRVPLSPWNLRSDAAFKVQGKMAIMFYYVLLQKAFPWINEYFGCMSQPWLDLAGTNNRDTYINNGRNHTKIADATVYHDFLGFILLVRNKREV